MFFKKPGIGQWGKLFFPMLVSLSFSRLLTQTDLYFIRNLSDAIILLAFFSKVATFDFVIAFAIVPTCLITVSKYTSNKIRTSLLSISFYCGIVVAFISAILSALLFFILKMDAKIEIPRQEFFVVLIINSTTIPFRWLQLSSTFLLHLEKKGNFVVHISFFSIFANYILDALLVKKLGYIGCLLATLLLTMITSTVFTLSLKSNILRIRCGKAVLLKSKGNILKELSRILMLNIGMNIVYGMILAGDISKTITAQFSIMFEFTNLLSVISVSIFRTTVILGKSSNKEKILSMVMSSFFILFVYITILIFKPTILKIYNIENADFFKFYINTIIFLLLVNAFESFSRADMQINNKFINTVFVETSVMYVFLIPFVYFSLRIGNYSLVVLSFIINGFITCILYLFSSKHLTKKTYTP